MFTVHSKQYVQPFIHMRVPRDCARSIVIQLRMHRMDVRACVCVIVGILSLPDGVRVLHMYLLLNFNAYEMHDSCAREDSVHVHKHELGLLV